MQWRSPRLALLNHQDSVCNSSQFAGVISISTQIDPSCGGCYVVADVTGFVYSRQVINQVIATAVTEVVSGENGTQALFISFTQGISAFSFGSTGLLDTASGLETPFSGLSSTFIFSGVTVSVRPSFVPI